MTPDGWTRKRIGDLGKVQAGRQRAPQFTTGKLRPYLRVANVFDGYIDTADVLRMAFSDKEFQEYRLQPGDVLLNEGQSLELVGRSAIYEGEPSSCCFQNTLIRFRPGPETNSAFAHFIFQYLQYTGMFARTALQTTSVAHLGVSRFASLRVEIPPPDEQRAIADFLATWTKMGCLLRKSLADTRKRRLGLAHQLLTGKRRFHEFVQSSESRPTRYGRFPVDWECLRIGDIASEVNARGSVPGSIPVLSCTKYRGLVDSLEYFGKRVFSDNTEGYKLVRRNQFAYATNHIEEGSLGLLVHRDAGLVSPMYTVFETGNRIHPTFLYSLLKTEVYRQIFQANTNSSVDRRGGLRWPHFANIHLWLPSIPEQEKISTVLTESEREITLICQEIELVEKQKRWLMARLLTGQVRLPAKKQPPAEHRSTSFQDALGSQR